MKAATQTKAQAGRRRRTVSTAIGGGSGGGLDSHTQNGYADGVKSITANQIELTAQMRLPGTIPSPPAITMLAGDPLGLGKVDVRGAQGVRITSGPPPLPATTSLMTNGVEIATGQAQMVTIQRGLIPGVDQKIEMLPGMITVDAGAGIVHIESLTEIKLSVAGGMSSITLTPAGIIIQGILVKIN
jgi:hypothetical protein